MATVEILDTLMLLRRQKQPLPLLLHLIINITELVVVVTVVLQARQFVCRPTICEVGRRMNDWHVFWKRRVEVCETSAGRR